MNSPSSETIEEYQEEIARLKSIMIAAWHEIDECWDDHCDIEGFGPVNLMNKLKGKTLGCYDQYLSDEMSIKRTRKQMLGLRDIIPDDYTISPNLIGEALRLLFFETTSKGQLGGVDIFKYWKDVKSYHKENNTSKASLLTSQGPVFMSLEITNSTTITFLLPSGKALKTKHGEKRSSWKWMGPK